MGKLRHGRPLWLDRSSHRERRFPRHHGTQEVDIAIVGGGITGAIAAYLFSEAGVRVAVLEARRVGMGSTLASTALLMQEPDKDFCELADRYGRRAAREIWMLLRGATLGLARTIEGLKIKCDLHERDSIYFTLDAAKLPRLRREFRERKRQRLPGRWLSAEQLYRNTGIRGEGAIATSRNAEADPLKVCFGFLKAAMRRGATVFENSRVEGVTSTRDGVRLKTAAGVVNAEYLLVATGYATAEFKPLAGRFRLKDTFVIASRVLSPQVRRAFGHAMLWDAERPYHYIRWTADGRLLIGGADIDHGAKRPVARMAAGRATLTEYLSIAYPALAHEKPEYAWEGLFAETPDGLPYVGVHRKYPRHFFALGYGGNGMTASFLAAKLLLARYRKHPRPEEKLFSFARRASGAGRRGPAPR